MLSQLKELSRLRKYYLAYQFFTKSTNIFLIAITIRLIIDQFGDDGLIVKDYMIPVLGLFIFVPFLSNYIVDNAKSCFKWIIVVEVISLLLYSAAEKGFFPEVTLVMGIVTLTVSNVFVSPLRVKNTSQVVDNDKEYSILSERVNSVFTVLLSGIGLLLLTYGVPSDVNIVLTMIFVLLSRFSYLVVLDELECKNEQ
tara:strand:+ start:9810 stop:10400 length:591 start_codon:yes stop_codon:yes gene_type:complete